MAIQTEQNMALSGKRIVLLGGTSGIGFATAQLAHGMLKEIPTL